MKEESVTDTIQPACFISACVCVFVCVCECILRCVSSAMWLVSSNRPAPLQHVCAFQPKVYERISVLWWTESFPLYAERERERERERKKMDIIRFSTAAHAGNWMGREMSWQQWGWSALSGTGVRVCVCVCTWKRLQPEINFTLRSALWVV